MWCVPYTPGSCTIGSVNSPVAVAGSFAKTSRPTRKVPIADGRPQRILIDALGARGVDDEAAGREPREHGGVRSGPACPAQSAR